MMERAPQDFPDRRRSRSCAPSSSPATSRIRGSNSVVRAARLQHGHDLARQRVGEPRPGRSRSLWRIGFWLIVSGRSGPTATLFALGTVELAAGPEAQGAGLSGTPSGLSSPARAAGFSRSGSSPFSPSAANGSRCGSRRSGTVGQAAFRIVATSSSGSPLRRPAGRRALRARRAREADVAPLPGRRARCARRASCGWGAMSALKAQAPAA